MSYFFVISLNTGTITRIQKSEWVSENEKGGQDDRIKRDILSRLFNVLMDLINLIFFH